jgi:peptidyl-tRNA hydrolase, PTH1 family
MNHEQVAHPPNHPIPFSVNPISVIIGLGNPGQKYDQTRHNIGFMVVDHLAKSWRISLVQQKKFKGYWAEKSLTNGEKLHLLKPTTFMNLSGESAIALVKWYKLKPESVLAVYDDLDLPLGKIRIKPSGSAGGHNGMKSLIAHLGTQGFPRLRLGIGTPNQPKLNSQTALVNSDLGSTQILAKKVDRDPDRVVSHVLGCFNSSESKAIPGLMALSQNAISSIFDQGMEKAMSIYNSRTIDI